MMKHDQADGTVSTSQEIRPAKRIEVISRGILVSGGHILLCRDREGDYAYLPGGHVDPGESAAQALARELEEEAGLTAVVVGACAMVTEQRFTQKKRRRHEINVVFHVEHALLPDSTPLPLSASSDYRPAIESMEPHIEFIWVEAAALSEVDLRPLSMKAWLMTPRSQPPRSESRLDRADWLSHSDR